MLRILYDDFEQKVKNIHDEMDLHHSYKKKRVHVHYGSFRCLALPNFSLRHPTLFFGCSEIILKC